MGLHNGGACETHVLGKIHCFQPVTHHVSKKVLDYIVTMEGE